MRNGSRRSFMGTSEDTRTSPYVRGKLRTFQKMIKRADSLLDEHMDDIVKFAKNVANDPHSTVRDRIRAQELLATIAREGAKMDFDLEKIDKTGDGEITINVNFVDMTNRNQPENPGTTSGPA